MHGGFKTTFDILASSNNDAAVEVLVVALDASLAEVREAAFRALLARRSVEGRLEILRRWHLLDERQRGQFAEQPARVSGAVRDAILSPDPQLRSNGCNAVKIVREFDLIPALLNTAEDESNSHAALAAETVLDLANLLYDELAAPRDYKNRRDPQLVRQYVVGSLELSVARFAKHRRREIVEAFLVLANRDNACLKRLLQNPHDPAFLTVVDLLTHGARPGIMRLVLGYLEDPHAPLTTINVLSHRGDEPFVRHLLAKIGFEPTQPARLNLRRMESITWLRDNLPLIDGLNEASQHAAVQLATCSAMPRAQVFKVLARLMEGGAVGGRRAASLALAPFKGNDANQLALRGLADADPQVQANLLSQLRDRGIPGAVTRLIDAVESEHSVVRKAAQRCLAEFSFKRYLSAFDTLEPEVRRSTGALVRRVDPDALNALRQEIEALGRSRRIRSIEIAVALNVVRELEDKIISLLTDEDHFVRVEAALALGSSDSAASREALREALLDRSVTVQEAAEKSLRALSDARPAVSVGALGGEFALQSMEQSTCLN